MRDHEHTEGFCRTCHCRRIAVERAGPDYDRRRREGLDRWSDARAGIAVTDDERPMVRWLRQKGFDATKARKVIIRSRRALDQGGADGG